MSRYVNMATRSLVLGALAACGPKPVPPPPPVPVPVAAIPDAPVVDPDAPVFAGLFEPRATTFRAFFSMAEGDAKDMKETNVTCTVNGVRQAGDDRELTLACVGEIDVVVAPAGTLVWRSDGLWLRGGGPPLLSGELSDMKLMDTKPFEGPVAQPRPSDDRVTLERFADGWCIRTRWWRNREDRGWTLCFEHGAIIGGAGTHSGYGRTHDVRFGLAP